MSQKLIICGVIILLQYGIKEIFSWLFFINALILIGVIILERKRPEKTIAWILVLVILPTLGLILYVLVGRNWKRKRNKLNEHFDIPVKDNLAIENCSVKSYYKNLIKLLSVSGNSPLFSNNSITVFKDGKEKFAVFKEQLRKAKHHIHLEYYIVNSDELGNQIKDILIEKAKEGLKVRFIMDRVGSIKVKRKFIRDLRNAGVDVVHYSYFLAPLFRFINTQINYRNHRKIAVIDGQIGFIGGINIGDEYLGKSKLGYWRDTHLMVRGDFVLGLQAVFLNDYWIITKSRGEDFFRKENFQYYFSRSPDPGSITMQLSSSGPDSEYPSIMQGFLKMIALAKKHIYITTPYFVPTESIMDMLKAASLSGIDVRILFPGKSDHALVHFASRTYLSELIKCGAKVYLYDQKSFLHAKVLTVDGKVSTVGTANMDIRSFELNYEINAVIYDEDITGELERMFHEDLQKSVLITQSDLERTPKLTKTFEAVSRVFSSFF